MKQYIIDAFTSEPFSGNPAAVCIMDAWPSEAAMMLLARENNLSETAFIVPEQGAYRLRWFTPATEIELCGHATLASAFAILNLHAPGSSAVCFYTVSGALNVTRHGTRYEMDFPQRTQREIPVTDAMQRAFGARPLRAFLGADLLCVFENEAQVRALAPDQALLAQLDGRIQNATAPGAPGSGADCASRSFVPKHGIPEDPVCGSAHCQIAPYWARELGKTAIDACQASARGGRLHCELRGSERLAISGEAVHIATSEIHVPL